MQIISIFATWIGTWTIRPTLLLLLLLLRLLLQHSH